MGLAKRRERTISETGDYEAWIAATAENSGPPAYSYGYSAHAWEIRPKRNPQPAFVHMNKPEPQSDGDVQVSDGLGSNQNRAFATGAYRIAEALPDGAKAHIVTPDDYIVGIITNLTRYRGNGFHRAGKKPLEHSDWWKLFDAECLARSLTVTAEKLHNGHYDGGMICKRLKQAAVRACAAKTPRRPGHDEFS